MRGSGLLLCKLTPNYRFFWSQIPAVIILRKSTLGRSVMRTLLASAGLALLLALASEPSVSAQEAPEWMKQTLPDQALKPHWDEYMAVMNSTGALDGKTKNLIGLGVAAQIPCEYCVYAHTKAAKAAGATDAQIKEAIATAALVRFNSTMLNGSDGGREWPSRK